MWRRMSLQTRGNIEEEEYSSNNNSNNSSPPRRHEMFWEEFLIRSSRPLPPMSASSRAAKIKKQTTPNNSNCNKTSPRPIPGLSFEEPTSSEMARLLKELSEREQDLELAANLGNSLLQENKELLEKNEFLEESLATSNETISQLQRHLKQRSKLFRTIVDLENEYVDEEEDDKACCSSSSCARSVDFSRLEKKLSNLEKENTQLRTKVDDLEEQKLQIEKREGNVVSDYISQLRGANLKIAQFQVQLSEKTKQCESQTEEIQRLLSDISERKRREHILWDENEDIQARLDQAVRVHENLRSEMEQLQERHLDLIVMLRDTEDELREHRQRAEAPPPIRRTNSVDSLYDSLASELEGADSGGCYGTPMFSARYGPSTHCSSLGSGGCVAVDQQQQFPSQQQPSTSSALINTQQPSIELPPSIDQHQNFDVPSRALLEAVRSTLEDRKQFQRLNNFIGKQKSHGYKEDNEENKVKECQPIDSPTTPIVESNKQQIVPCKVFQDACCSPIQFSSIDSTPQNNNTNKLIIVESASTTHSTLKNLLNYSTPQNSKKLNQKNSISSGSSTESIDSLVNYCPPKLGTPGRPGSKDLDFSIRRLSLKKEMNESYARYRNSKGLPPTPNNFYSPSNGTNYQFVYQSSFPSICPTKQLKRLCIDSINNNSPPIISKSSPECSRFSYRQIKEKGNQQNNNLNLLSSLGLGSNSNDNYKNGIFNLVDLFVKNNNGGDNNKSKTITTSGSCSSLFSSQLKSSEGFCNLSQQLNSSCSSNTLSVITTEVQQQQNNINICGGVLQRYDQLPK